MFPVLVFASHFEILLVRKPDTRPECFTTHLVAHTDRFHLCSIHSMYPHTKRYGRQKQKFRTIKVSVLPLCTACVTHDVASCTAHITFTGIRVNLAHFLDVYNPKIVRLSREFIFKQFMSTERRENARCNEYKFVSRDSQFPWCLSCCFWYVYHSFTRRVQLIMGNVYVTGRIYKGCLTLTAFSHCSNRQFRPS
jgi:hypothetical protein